MSIFFESSSSQLTQGPDVGNSGAAIEGGEHEGAYNVLVAATVDAALSDEEAKEFCTAEETRNLIDKGIVKEETLEGLGAEEDLDEKLVVAAALNIAQNQGDPTIEEIVEKKEEVEELINDVVDKNREEAEAVVESYKRNIVPGSSILTEAVNRFK